MPPGRVIFIFGTSSAGKSTTAGALQRLLPDPFLVLGLDTLFSMVPDRWGSAGGEDAGGFWYERRSDQPLTEVIRRGPVGTSLLKGMRAAVRAFADAGNNVIVDEMPIDSEVLAMWRQDLAAHQVLWVRQDASDEVLVARELSRARTRQGLALGHLPIVREADWADLDVDASDLSPEQCAETVAAALLS